MENTAHFLNSKDPFIGGVSSAFLVSVFVNE